MGRQIRWLCLLYPTKWFWIFNKVLEETIWENQKEISPKHGEQGLLLDKVKEAIWKSGITKRKYKVT